MSVSRVKSYLLYYIAIAILFALAYLPANRLAESRSDVAIFALSWETNIPFVSWMIFPYLSIMLLFWVPLFLLDREQTRRLAINMAWATVVCGLAFLVYPTTVSYARPDGGDGILALFQAFYLFDKPYNAFPSLHIAYSYLCVISCIRESPSPARFVLIPWLLTIVLSVLLTHQHHLPDVVAAMLLAHTIQLLTKPRVPARS